MAPKYLQDLKLDNVAAPMIPWLPASIAIALATASAGGAFVSAVGLSSQFDDGPSETKDRLSPEVMEQLAGPAIERVRQGDLAGGERLLEAMLAQRTASGGAVGLEAADLVSSFGVLLYNEGLDQSDDRLRERSMVYLARAVPMYKAVFGASHPEVAVILHSYADVEMELRPDNPSAQAEAALEEAYRIRLATLGPDNEETRSGLARLAELRGLPSRTQGDPARIAAAAALIERAMEGAGDTAGNPLTPSRLTMHFALARLYTRNGLLPQALRAVERAESEARSSADPIGENCLLLVSHAHQLADLLEERGFGAEAEALAKRYPLAMVLSCAEPGEATETAQGS